jgi:HPt (histidine-containing phosphotransfer) domain-containing protein
VPESIRAQLRTRNFDSALQLAHTLVSAAGYMGADGLAELAKQVQQACQQRDTAQCEATNLALELEFELVRRAVSAYLADAARARDLRA